MAIYTVRFYIPDHENGVLAGARGQVWSTAGEALDFAMVAFRNTAIHHDNHPAVTNISKIVILRDDQEPIYTLANNLVDD